MLYCLEWNKVKLRTYKRKNSTILGGTANFSMRVTNLSGYPKCASRRYCAHGGPVLLWDIIRRVCNKISMVFWKEKNEKKNTDSACASRRYREDPWCSMHDARVSRRAVKLAGFTYEAAPPLSPPRPFMRRKELIIARLGCPRIRVYTMYTRNLQRYLKGRCGDEFLKCVPTVKTLRCGIKISNEFT